MNSKKVRGSSLTAVLKVAFAVNLYGWKSGIQTLGKTVVLKVKNRWRDISH